MVYKSLTSAFLNFFGKLPGQTTLEFQAELKKLDDGDRAYFVKEFGKIGIEIIPA